MKNKGSNGYGHRRRHATHLRAYQMIPQARPASSLLEHLVRMEFPGWLFIPELGNFNLYHFLVFIFCQELVSDLEEDARNTTSRKASGEATSSQGNYHPTSVRVRASACLSAFGQPLSSRTLNRSLGLIALIVTHWSWTPQTLQRHRKKPYRRPLLLFLDESMVPLYRRDQNRGNIRGVVFLNIS